MKKIFFSFLLLCFAVAMYAVPARQVPITHKQSDGTELYVVLTGDETFHYYVTLDGLPVIKGENGDFFHASFTAEDGFTSTGCIAHNESERTFEELQVIAVNEFAGVEGAISTQARAARMNVPAPAASVSPFGEVNVPVLLVEYSDVKFTFTKEEVSDVLNKENYEGYDNPIAKNIGSAKDYFVAQSGGKFVPNFIVTDIITLPNAMAYYGAPTSNSNDVRPAQMIADGLSGADANFDFSIFDNNGDGEAEFVYCIYAGYGENVGGNDENTIWPHQFELSSKVGKKVHDGVTFNTYACSSELAMNEDFSEHYGGKYLAGIGTMCHEFSHCLGLPDLYDTSKTGTGMSTFGYWDLMDSGSYAAEGYVPVGYSAYERDFMGWRTLEVLSEKGDYSMKPLTSGGNGYKIVNDANTNEYYVLENRAQEGWDTYLFNAGMLISHIDYISGAWNGNYVNNDKNHLRLSLVPADDEILIYDGTNGAAANASYKADVWPGTTGNTAFTDTSIPAASLFTGGCLGKPVTDISLSNGVVSFSFLKGIVVTPAIFPATDITGSSFCAAWEPVEENAEYTVELEKVVQLADGEGSAVALLSEDFIGCVNADEAITNVDDYMLISGWTGSKLYSGQGVMRIGASSSAGSLKTPQLNYTGEITVSFSLAKYADTDENSVITVSLVNTNGVAVNMKNFNATSDWKNVEITFEAAGNFYIELSTAYGIGSKRVNIDDFAVYYNTSTLITLIDRVTTTATNHQFTDLEGATEYRYRVSASDGYGSSAFSPYETVTLLPVTSIDDTMADGSTFCEVYTIAGVLVYYGSADNLSTLAAGTYVVKVGNVVNKIIVE